MFGSKLFETSLQLRKNEYSKEINDKIGKRIGDKECSLPLTPTIPLFIALLSIDKIRKDKIISSDRISKDSVNFEFKNIINFYKKIRIKILCNFKSSIKILRINL